MKGYGLTYRRSVAIWLFTGLVMIFGQIWIGGITRLTGSGLSITKWEIITGTLPPLSASDWEYEFERYRQTPQYALINKGMSMSEFKYIYFWEYLHRLWARIMGFIFVVPFFWFLYKKYLSNKLIRDLLVLILLTAITASFGWIMVASGLIVRPWVNAYKLSIHLLLGFSVFVFLYTIYQQYVGKLLKWNRSVLTTGMIGLIILQIFLGGMMSGMRIGFTYPTWPLMHGSYVPGALLNSQAWIMEALVDYDKHDLMPALVQFLHRNVGYLIGVLGMLSSIMLLIRRKLGTWRVPVLLFTGLLVVQVLVGILTLIGFREGMPVVLASVHQMLGLALLTSAVHLKLFTSEGLSWSLKKEG